LCTHMYIANATYVCYVLLHYLCMQMENPTNIVDIQCVFWDFNLISKE